MTLEQSLRCWLREEQPLKNQRRPSLDGLLNAYNEWALSHDGVLCQRRTFKRFMHCPRGHWFHAGSKRGERLCRTCHRQCMAERRREQRQPLAAWLEDFLRAGPGDTSRYGNLCTFAESRCNVLNRLVGQ
jgi:hypothetical protein